MADGEYDEDDLIHRPLPAPDDRLWRHPSETAWGAQAADPVKRWSWMANTLWAGGGALLVGVLWLVSSSSSTVQIVTQRVAAVPIESVAPRVTPAEDWSDEVTRGALQSIALVRSPEGTVTLAGAIAVRDDGYLLTSGRALGDRTSVLIHTAAGVVATAWIVGYDPATDLSVLKTDADMIPALIAAEPADDGDIVALLDPDGESRSQTVVDRASSSTAIDGDHLVGLLALDGTLGDIPPGSPVVDHTGAIVGITTATSTDAPVAAVPIALATRIASDLISYGTTDHPRMGITARDSLDDDPTVGSYVTSVQVDGPADLGGIHRHDVIIEIAGRSIESMAQMVATLRGYEPGDLVEVLVERDSAVVSCLVELAADSPGG